MFDDLFQESHVLLNTDDIYYKFDEWKRQKGKNILLVTGLSGSGKSTLTDELTKKHNAIHIYLDDFDQLQYQYDETGLLLKFMRKEKIDVSSINEKFDRAWEIPGKDYDELISRYFEFIISEMHKKPNTLYIIEGLQLFVYIDKSLIQNFPMVIKGTSYLTSQYRRLSRDGSSKNLIGNVIDEIKSIGITAFKVNLNDQSILKSLRKDIENKQRGNDGMFSDLLREAVMPDEYYLPNGDGKIKAFEDAFGEDEIKKSIAYGFSSSHEYDEPEKKKSAVKSCIKFVNNYNWKKKDHKVDDIEAFNKPLNMKKVFNITKTIEEKGNTEPLITVDKIHGFNWQSKGKSILTDGNHRLGAIKVLELKTCPVYHGSYTGNAERDHEEFIPPIQVGEDGETIADDNFITEAVFEQVPSIKNFFMESANEYQILQEASRKRKKIEKIQLTSSEREAVEAKYGQKLECSFAKDKISGKYFCYTHRAMSKMYDSPTDIPKDTVRFIGSTG